MKAQDIVPTRKGCQVEIQPMTADHAGPVLAIYQAGLDSGNASFETVAPSWHRWDTGHLAEHRFVGFNENDQVIGWIGASRVSTRPVYAGVIEHSVYVHPAAQGCGVGRLLLSALIVSAEAAGVWTIQTGIFPENSASLALHRSAGFRVVGTRERIGCHHGRWRDVIFIERSSSIVSSMETSRVCP